MNINKLNQGLNDSTQKTNSGPSGSQATPEPSKGDGVNPSQGTSAADQVKLSASGRSIQQIEADIKSLPEVNDATIERIRNAIAEGEFKVDYQRLAGKMLQFDDQLN